MADGKITIETEIDTSEAEKDLESLKKEAEQSLEPLDKASKDAESALSDVAESAHDTSDALADVADASQDTADSANELDKYFAELDDVLDSAESSLDDVAKASEETAQKQEELKQDLVQTAKETDDLLKSAEKLGNAIHEQAQDTKTASQAYVEHKQKLDDLKQKYIDLVAAGNKESAVAQDVAKEIKELSRQVNDEEQALEAAKKDADRLTKSTDDLGDESKETGNALSKLGSVAKGAMKGAVAGLKAGATAAVGLTTAFLATAEATRETRIAMGKVETAFTTMGYSAETGKKTYMDFVSILGDTDQATEAVGNLAKLATSEQDLTRWTTIATGVYATFGDGLPIEGLTEAANETAKVAQVTGPLADAINWSTTSTEDWNKALSSNETALAAFNRGISAGENAEDSFNLALQACNSEQERSQLITATLSSLYGDAAKTYEETSGSILDANRAQAELNDAMAQVGEVAEPVMAALKSTGASILTDFLPSVQLLGEGLQDIFNGDMGGTDKIGQAVGDMITTITDKIIEYAPQLVDVGVGVIEAIVDGISENPDKIAEATINIVVQLFSALTQMIPQIIELGLQLLIALAQGITDNVDTIVQAFVTMIQELVPLLSGDNLTQIVQIALQLIQTLANSLVENLPMLQNAFMQIFTSLVEALPDIIVMIIEALPQLIEAIVTFISEQIPIMLNVSLILFMTIVKAIPKIVIALVKALPSIIRAIIDGLKNLPSNLWNNVLIPTINKFGDFVSNAKDKATEAGRNFLTNVIDHIKELPGKVKEKVDAVIEKVKSFATDFANKAKQAGSDFKDKIVNEIKELPDKMLEIGGNIVEGIWDGINNKFDWLTGKIQSFTDNVTSKLKNFFGIHSPSRVMRDEIGKFLALGIAEGITKNEDTVVKAAEHLGDKTTAAFKRIRASQALQFRVSDEITTSVRNSDAALARSLAISQTAANKQTQAGIDYKQMGKATAQGIKSAGIAVNIDGRKAGRVLDTTPKPCIVGGFA